MSRLARTLAAALLALAALTPATALAEDRIVLAGVTTDRYPEVTLSLQLPAEMHAGTGAAPSFTVLENGERVRSSASGTTVTKAVGTNVALVIDTSGSMRGKALSDAQAAAVRFVESMGPKDRVTLIGFGAKPVVVVPPTGDSALLVKGIGSLKAGGDTALYDALLVSVRLLKTLGGKRTDIVVLSDGADTVSTTKVDTVLQAVATARTPVHAVALKTAETDFAPLQSISKRSGGRLVTVSASSGLAGLFEGIARELTDRFEVRFTSNKPPTADLEIDVTATSGSRKAALSTVIDNPALGLSDGISLEEWRATGKAQPLFLAAAVTLSFFAVSLLVVSALLLLVRHRPAIDQLHYYDQLGRADDGGENARPNRVKTSIMSALGYVAGKRGLTTLMRDKLDRAGLPLRPLEYMYFHTIAVVTIGFTVQLLAGNVALSILAVMLAVLVPLVLLEHAIARRKAAFENQLPDVLDMLSGSLRAGWGIQQAMELVAEEMPPPVSSELGRVLTEARLGLSVESALEKMADRLGSDDFRWTVSAIRIQRDVGGNLAEVLDIVAKTIRSRAELRRQVSALTAEGRISAWVLLALPFVVFGALLLMNPEYAGRMFTSTIGVFMAVIGAVLLLIGAVWVMRVVKVEV